jgi:polyhydroxybutyrate depolymerase
MNEKPGCSRFRYVLFVACVAGALSNVPCTGQEAQQAPTTPAIQEASPEAAAPETPAQEAKPPDTPQPQEPQQAAPAQAKDSREEVYVNEHARTYSVHLPAGYDSKQRYPVGIVLHGFDQDGAEIARITHFNELADADGIIAVYPNAVAGRWNLGVGEGRPYYRQGPYRRPGVWGPGYPPPGQRREPGERGDGRPRNMDMQFFHRMLDKVASHYSVDTQRIYATGLGEGGFMALRMGCNMSGRIAAVAVVGAAMPKMLNCDPPRAVSVLLMNGTDDPIVHYNGGQYKDGLLHLHSAEDSAKEWARVDRCSGKPAESKLPSLQEGGRETKVFLYNDCEEGAQVALYEIKGGGHTWPGGEQYLSEKEVGRTSKALNANETIWGFLVTKKISGERGMQR